MGMNMARPPPNMQGQVMQQNMGRMAGPPQHMRGPPPQHMMGVPPGGQPPMNFGGIYVID